MSLFRNGNWIDERQTVVEGDGYVVVEGDGYVVIEGDGCELRSRSGSGDEAR